MKWLTAITTTIVAFVAIAYLCWSSAGLVCGIGLDYLFCWLASAVVTLIVSLLGAAGVGAYVLRRFDK